MQKIELSHAREKGKQGRHALEKYPENVFPILVAQKCKCILE